jgi:diguanylate cyclase (GGDEF)-like protein
LLQTARLPGIAFFFLLFLYTCAVVSAEQAAPVREVSGREMESGGTVTLHGTWELYPGRFLGRDRELPKPVLFEVPAGWNGDTVDRRGFATYRKLLRVTDPPEGGLALRIGFVPTAYRLFVNGILLGGVGTPAADPREHKPQWYPKTYLLPPEKNGRFDVRIEVANHSHAVGGLRSSVVVGTAEHMQVRERRRALRDWIVIGAFLFIGIYHGLMYLLQRKERLLAWFALVCLALAVNSGCNNSIFWNSLFPSVPWAVFLRLEYISFYVLVVSFVLFLGKLLEREPPKWPLRLYIGANGVLALVSLFGPVFWMTFAVRIGQGLFVAAAVWFAVQAVIGLRRKKPHALPVFIGIVAAGLIAAHDAFYYMGILGLFPLADYAGILFVGIQTFSLALRFTTALEQERELSDNLAAANERLELMVEEDPVTGLPNRIALHRNLTDEISRAKRSGRALSLLFIDLDNFKHVNDTMGHQAGDEILRRVADRMHRVVRKTDRLFRIGGDEFVLLCLDLAGPDDIIRVAESLTSLLRQTFGLSEREIFLGASIGVAVYPDHGTDATMLLQNADAAMYAAKRAGKGRYSLFTDVMGWKASEHVSVGGRLPRALQANLLSVVFQPQVNTRTLKMTSAEALLRWSDPELGVVSPSRFIPVAEESGLIVPIGRWVLEHTLMIFESMKKLDGNISVGINLSAEQLTYADLVPEFQKIIKMTHFNPRRLVLEVTEHAVMRNWSTSIKTLNDFRALGIRIALDDFGTGYSSLGNIRLVPADQLKIDMSFIRNIARSKKDEQLVRWITRLGHELDLEVCAEGIETKEQQEILTEIGVDLLQGFLFCKPVEASLAFQFTAAV